MNRAEAASLARKAKELRAPPLDIRFWSKVSKGGPDVCWPWVASTRNKREGYGAFWYQGRHHPAPRIAYFLATSTLVTDLQICHRCDNPTCCNPGHLFVGSGKENNDDKVNKLRHAFGVRNGNAKVTEEVVRRIRAVRPAHTLHEMAGMFDLDFTTISDICRRKSWKHVA